MSEFCSGLPDAPSLEIASGHLVEVISLQGENQKPEHQTYQVPSPAAIRGHSDLIGRNRIPREKARDISAWMRGKDSKWGVVGEFLPHCLLLRVPEILREITCFLEMKCSRAVREYSHSERLCMTP